MFISNLLRAFIITTRNKSMKNGADQLYITRSPLSRRIKILEERLGCKLFLRGRDGVHLTHEGQKLYNAIARHYDELILLESNFSNKFRSINKPTDPTHGFSISIEHCMLDCLSSLTHSQLRLIRKLTYRDYNDDISQHLLSGKFDIIISNKKMQCNEDDVSLLSYNCITINIVKSPQKTFSGEPVIIPAALLHLLDRMDVDWRKELSKNIDYHNDSYIDIIIVPEIQSHLPSIEHGEAIGLISSQALKSTSIKLNNIISRPLVINQSTAKIDLNIYFLKKKLKLLRSLFPT